MSEIHYKIRKKLIFLTCPLQLLGSLAFSVSSGLFPENTIHDRIVVVQGTGVYIFSSKRLLLPKGAGVKLKNMPLAEYPCHLNI